MAQNTEKPSVSIKLKKGVSTTDRAMCKSALQLISNRLEPKQLAKIAKLDKSTLDKAVQYLEDL